MKNKPFFWAGTEHSRISFRFATQLGHDQDCFGRKAKKCKRVASLYRDLILR